MCVCVCVCVRTVESVVKDREPVTVEQAGAVPISIHPGTLHRCTTQKTSVMQTAAVCVCVIWFCLC